MENNLISFNAREMRRVADNVLVHVVELCKKGITEEVIKSADRGFTGVTYIISNAATCEQIEEIVEWIGGLEFNVTRKQNVLDITW
jgi:hypothetical protein